MATTAQWIEGARPRTLPNAIAPVLVGTGAAASLDAAVWWKALLALVVSLALIIGVNYANDYSDGIRGTDDERVGPLRLVGSKLASPGSVKAAAIGCFVVGGVAGLVLAATTAWWLVVVGAVCIAGAWYYTGGTKPYGYAGLGEIAVFVFFGLVAVLGTQFVQADRVDWVGLVAAIAVGSFSSAVLVANNLRDIDTDPDSGKLTLAVKLGDTRTRLLHLALMVVPFAVTVALAARTPWALVALIALPLAARANKPVRSGQTGFALIPALRDSGLAMLVWGLTTGAALAFA
ncbi:1,4-dihydroxy-2-naphthoate polyprenyltransferase [Rhodococcus sp. BP-252]|uniref:1,4-dihydroxy-2-naphthoate polyprenyltransferase n=1 Tax=unclassified Rhodococcus (in: high G+C Gram-positive bacteria) TaxID=192944 RepID=UPI0014315477|nr:MULTISPECIES: 1,4-dihydroxy-2-naphthoate polyprenyltransferase [unclassified Rhodococcus (in: high G+C Gram-positive bacteria)]MBY6414885.1 1,4-dihydroxy-2-naphthoate polyprenyltransferase [Rhodococcus sp. BP-320]MBY6419846.1 1,4-dihydroxy-2-naphthoate polyprenyltransferase [Rhodococcus sp. BP-321]MBY6424818.1 1,4-dihydroxy-2-naphthoate polyprenyltransferase [Rhodococcus sp. BP-324]MBY6429778.1 1,4-dihydroxy-2-naphthoate polyprenyltransferase [Rhodococcus sp. BP-323]MBY6434739.1 1,4-dihydro